MKEQPREEKSLSIEELTGVLEGAETAGKELDDAANAAATLTQRVDEYITANKEKERWENRKGLLPGRYNPIRKSAEKGSVRSVVEMKEGMAKEKQKISIEDVGENVAKLEKKIALLKQLPGVITNLESKIGLIIKVGKVENKEKVMKAQQSLDELKNAKTAIENELERADGKLKAWSLERIAAREHARVVKYQMKIEELEKRIKELGNDPEVLRLVQEKTQREKEEREQAVKQERQNELQKIQETTEILLARQDKAFGRIEELLRSVWGGADIKKTLEQIAYQGNDFDDGTGGELTLRYYKDALANIITYGDVKEGVGELGSLVPWLMWEQKSKSGSSPHYFKEGVWVITGMKLQLKNLEGAQGIDRQAIEAVRRNISLLELQHEVLQMLLGKGDFKEQLEKRRNLGENPEKLLQAKEEWENKGQKKLAADFKEERRKTREEKEKEEEENRAIHEKIDALIKRGGYPVEVPVGKGRTARGAISLKREGGQVIVEAVEGTSVAMVELKKIADRSKSGRLAMKDLPFWARPTGSEETSQKKK